ncbi:MAG: hypothetical protein ACI86C_001281, partial [Candidatus Latescibacterota bacterium]
STVSTKPKSQNSISCCQRPTGNKCRKNIFFSTFTICRWPEGYVGHNLFSTKKATPLRSNRIDLWVAHFDPFLVAQYVRILQLVNNNSFTSKGKAFAFPFDYFAFFLISSAFLFPFFAGFLNACRITHFSSVLAFSNHFSHICSAKSKWSLAISPK